jgi:hypothetical protein
MVENYPQLIIIPNPDFDSFNVFLKTGARETDIESVADVVGIDWKVKGHFPGWGGLRGYAKNVDKPKTLILSPAPSRKEMFILGAKYFFGDKEFLITELIAKLKDRYPKCHTNMTPKSVATTMRYTRYFSTRVENHQTHWRYVGEWDSTPKGLNNSDDIRNAE